MRKINPYLYLEGMKLCDEGKRCPEDAHKDVVAGYNTQYQHEQNMTEISERGHYRTIKRAV